MTSRSNSPFVILADSREQAIPPMPDGVIVERATLHEGDYGTKALTLCEKIAVIERKSPGDFAGTITHDRERFDREVQRLQAYRWKCVVIEGHIRDVWRGSAVHPNSVIGSVASFYARYDVPCLFVGTPAGAGRLICGLLKRWQERLIAEKGAAA